MNFRFRPTLLSLETRENPSVPGLDPIGGTAPPPADPLPAPAPTEPATTYTDPTLLMISVATTIAITTAQANDPLLQNNSVYNVPLVP